jgi:hypothetical protein
MRLLVGRCAGKEAAVGMIGRTRDVCKAQEDAAGANASGRRRARYTDAVTVKLQH